jgi:hypothetical protein
MFRTLVIALILTGVATVAHAVDVYRYVDAQGGIHYSDTWVPGSQLIKMDHRPNNIESGAAGRAPENKAVIAGSNHASAEVAQDATVRAVQADVAAAREQQCTDAKAKYEKSIQVRRIYKSDTANADGEREFLTDEQADAYRVQLRTEMQTVCGNATK